MAKKKHNLDIINLPNVPVRLKYDSRALKKLVILPDHNPGYRLDVGNVAVFGRKDHKVDPDLIGSDIGCGMLLAKAPYDDDQARRFSDFFDKLDPDYLKRTVGGGNHFINLYQISNSIDPEHKERDFCVLIHTGRKSKRSYDKDASETELLDYVHGAQIEAKEHRRDVLSSLGLGDLEILVDRSHNTIETAGDDIIYRKGAIKLTQGELGVIPSHALGEAVLVHGKERISELENSMCHGSGRRVSRAEQKEDGGAEYRELSEIKDLIRPYVSMTAKLLPVTDGSYELNLMHSDIIGEVKSLDGAMLEKRYAKATVGMRSILSSTKIDSLDPGSATHFLSYSSAIEKIDSIRTSAAKRGIDAAMKSEYARAVEKKEIMEEFSRRYRR